MAAGLCPRFHKAIELVGRRWTGAILHILMHGRARFTTIADAIPDISDRMLSERLHALEHDGLLVRTVLPESPIRVEYALTEKGRELQASLEAVASWAERWLPAETIDRETARAVPPRRPSAPSARRATRPSAPAPRRARTSGRGH